MKLYTLRVSFFLCYCSYIVLAFLSVWCFFFFCYNRQIERFTPKINSLVISTSGFFFMDLQSVSNGIRIQKVPNKTHLSYYYYIVSSFRSGYWENITCMAKPYSVIIVLQIIVTHPRTCR